MHAQRSNRNKQAEVEVNEQLSGLTWQQEMFKQQASKSNVDLHTMLSRTQQKFQRRWTQT